MEMITNILLFFTATISICWSLPFIFGPFFGLQFYKVKDQKLVKLLKKLPQISSIHSDEHLEGWIIGWKYIGYLYNTQSSYGEEKRELYFFTTKKFFDKKMKDIENIDGDSDNDDNIQIPKLKLWERQGSYFHLYYSNRNFDCTGFEPRQTQLNIINSIKEFYNKNRYCVALLYGDKGTGKSMIPWLLAKYISCEDHEVNFCDTFKPTDPGDNFPNLYNSINPSKESPLIVVLEEFDITIHQIHYNKIIPHKCISTYVNDKTSWNQFLDRFDRKYFPWVILVLTSNSTPEMINSLDPSYIREGRINQIFKIVPAVK
jgi:hypothetical protein